MIKLFEMFSGYGGASFALKKAGIDFECVGLSEIDKYAIECYNNNHRVEEEGLGSIFIHKNFGDCTKIDPSKIPDFDLLTGGFPCQTFSIAGKGLGEQDTRGTLFHEIIRIAEVKKPKYMLLENVKGLTFKPHKATFDKIISELNRIGYNVTWQVLNSKEHGIPQNRERVFFVCFRDDSDTIANPFPDKEELKIFLKDILEEEVDEKYYLNEEQIKKLMVNFKKAGSDILNVDEIMKHINNKGRIVKKDDGTSFALTSSGRNCGSNQIVQLDVSQIKREGKPRVYKNISKCLNTAGGGGHTPLILQKHHSKELRVFDKGHSPTIGSNMGGNFPFVLDVYNKKIKPQTLNTEGKEVKNIQEIGEAHRIYSKEKISPTMKASGIQIYDGIRIRKLTPTECFRLMGFLDDGINLDGLSDTQKYRLAGNGWDII